MRYPFTLYPSEWQGVRSWILRHSDACLEEYKLIWPFWRTCRKAEDMYTLQPINCMASDTSQKTMLQHNLQLKKEAY